MKPENILPEGNCVTLFCNINKTMNIGLIRIEK